MLLTVSLATTYLGRAKISTRGSLEALRKRASEEIMTPGEMAPPRYSPSADMASKVVAVPKSTTMSEVAVFFVGGHGVHDAVGAHFAWGCRTGWACRF